MKDSYSFDIDDAGLDRAFQAHYQAYTRIFDRCGLSFTPVDASSGAMGGSQSTEFMVFTEAGEDRVAICPSCGYAANIEKAVARLDPIDDTQSLADKPVPFDTPDIRTIEQLARFTDGAPAERQIKTLIYVLDDKLTVILMRGDHELNETKLLAASGAQQMRPALEAEIIDALGARPGSLGAAGVTPAQNKGIHKIIADQALNGRRGMVTGANQDDVHLRGVDVARDIAVDLWQDLRLVKDGEHCTSCDGSLILRKALEIGHIFKLGTRYSQTMDAHVLDESGTRQALIMGSYGIGVERMIAAIAELSHDSAGLVWPASVAPFAVVIVPVNTNDPEVMASAEEIYQSLTAEGLDVLFDDRDERAASSLTTPT